MTTDNTQELDEILGKITGSLVDENIVPHDKYEDAVTDEDIVLLGQQLLDDAKQSILDWHNKQVEATLNRIHRNYYEGDKSLDTIIDEELDRLTGGN